MDRRGGFVHAVDREDVGNGGFDIAGDGCAGAHRVGTLPDLVRFIGKGIAVDHGFTLPWTAVEVGGNRALGTAATTVGAVTDRGVGKFQVKDGATIFGKRVGGIVKDLDPRRGGKAQGGRVTVGDRVSVVEFGLHGLGMGASGALITEQVEEIVQVVRGGITYRTVQHPVSYRLP